MPEYRRFIAYFYEYIDGRKQRNAGFAKVELRNGIWRLLFRLTAERDLELPAKIYGFVRAEGYLLGLPMGVMNTGQETIQEWAYRADVPIGEKYLVEDLSGLWIQSGDARSFLTVWDEEETDPGKFVLKLPEKAEPEMQGATAETMRNMPQERAEEEIEEGTKEEAGAEREAGESVKGLSNEGEPGESVKRISTGAVESAEIFSIADAAKESKSGTAAGQINHKPETQQSKTWEIQDLFRSRLHCQPFQDGEIRNCVMLRPCDIVWLQQRGWQVGRSSFLQHGFYQYRHLLLGTLEDDSYIIGVPGVHNPQEKYMAGMFGFTHFKESGTRKNNVVFGYWYRKLERRM